MIEEDAQKESLSKKITLSQSRFKFSFVQVSLFSICFSLVVARCHYLSLKILRCVENIRFHLELESVIRVRIVSDVIKTVLTK